MADGGQGVWEVLGQELSGGFDNGGSAVRIGVRLLAALVFGALLGLEREKAGKSAGLRTHMLVALGAATFVLCADHTGMSPGDLSRVIQGVATGIGFIGAGAILKLDDKVRIEGLTTAANIWMTAAVGMAAGAGTLWVGAAGVGLALIILAVLPRLERWAGIEPPHGPNADPGGTPRRRR